jgi:multiple sugar transport system permease protein
MSAAARSQFLKGITFVSPWIVGFTLFLLLPIVLSFYYSLCDWSLSELRPPLFIGLANYHELFQDAIFWKVLGNTFLYAAMALPAGLAVSLGLALLLNTQVPGQPLFRTIVFLPSLVPMVASAMLWLWLFNARLGLINTLLGMITPHLPFAAFIVVALVPVILLVVLIALVDLRIVALKSAPWFRIALAGLILLPALLLIRGWIFVLGANLDWIKSWLSPLNFQGPGWLTESGWALPALAFMSLWGVVHTVVIFLAGLQDVPRELYEAAEIDGASPSRRLWHVTLPMISPVIFFNLVMALIGTFQVFSVPYIMTGGGPDRATYFYSMYVFDNAFRYPGRMGYASAMAWIQLLIILILTAFAFWSSKKWVHYQGK